MYYIWNLSDKMDCIESFLSFVRNTLTKSYGTTAVQCTPRG